MRISARAAVLAAVATAVLVAPGCTVLADDRLPAQHVVQRVVDEVLAAEGVPAGVVLISEPGGGEVLAEFGEQPARGHRLDEANFAYRSITKSFVGTVVLQLADEGLVDPDAPISEYVAGVPGGERISVTDLATMRSGLPNYSASPGLAPALLAAPDDEPDVSTLLELAFDEPAGAPGEVYEYSNTNTLLLGEMITAVTGEPWDVVVAERLLRPLGLTSVAYGFETPGRDQRGHQVQGGSAPEPLPHVAAGWFGAAGALTGNVRDLAAWGRALGAGATVSPELHAFRLSQLHPIDADPASPAYDAYGFGMGELDGWIGHTGAGLGFQSLVMYDPRSEVVVAVLLNGTGEDQNLPARLFRALLAEGALAGSATR